MQPALTDSSKSPTLSPVSTSLDVETLGVDPETAFPCVPHVVYTTSRSWPETDAAGSPASRTQLCNQCLGLRPTPGGAQKPATEFARDRSTIKNLMTPSNGIEPCCCGGHVTLENATRLPTAAGDLECSEDEEMTDVLMAFSDISMAGTSLANTQCGEGQKSELVVSTRKKRKSDSDGECPGSKERKSRRGDLTLCTSHSTSMSDVKLAHKHEFLSEPEIEKRGTKRSSNHTQEDSLCAKQRTKRARKCSI